MQCHARPPSTSYTVPFPSPYAATPILSVERLNTILQHAGSRSLSENETGRWRRQVPRFTSQCMDHGIVFEHLEKRDKMQSIINTRRRYACLLAAARSCLQFITTQALQVCQLLYPRIQICARKGIKRSIFFSLKWKHQQLHSSSSSPYNFTRPGRALRVGPCCSHIKDSWSDHVGYGLMSCYLHRNE